LNNLIAESAGGACVHYHMNSPLSRGLFHRAISHSGTISNGWSDVARSGVALNNTINIAKRVNCTSIASSEIVACLRNVEGVKLAKALANMYEEFIDPAVLLQPVIESFNLNNDDDKPFISERDFVNNSISIPWLVGMNSEEGLLRVGGKL
jgi:carboxylesterase type B